MNLANFDNYSYAWWAWGPDGPDLMRTSELSLYLQRPGASVPGTFYAREVVSRAEARTRIASAEGDLYDPWTRALITPDVTWDRDLLIAAHWGVSASPPEWKATRWTEAADIIHDATTGHPAVPRLLAAFARQPESVKAAARERATSAPVLVRPSAPVGSSGRPIPSQQVLYQALLNTFSVDDLGRVLQFSPALSPIRSNLPTGTPSPASFMSAVLRQAEAAGLTRDLIEEAGAERRAFLSRIGW